MKSHYYPRGGFCPNCGKLVDGATGIDTEYLPKPGDISVCLYCATVLHFTANGTVERFPNWRNDLPADGRRLVERMVAGVRSLMITRAIS
jgi:hypothetical protein